MNMDDPAVDRYLLTHEEQQAALEQFRQRTLGQDVTLWRLIEFQFRCQVAKVLAMKGDEAGPLP